MVEVTAGTRRHHDRSRRVGRARQVLLLGAVAFAMASVGAGAYSLAVFTSTAANGSNVFTVGTITLGLSPASALVAFSAMVPGDAANGTLTVSNSGNAQLRYAMTTAATNADSKALKDQMTLVIKAKDTDTAGCANFNGAQLYSGTLGSGVIGDSATGAQAGDRTLGGPASEVLCFRATLPSGTGNAYEGATTTATFSFSAEQTANNP